MKTILVSILSGIEAKNILRTDIISRLLDSPDVQVVLLVKSEKRVELYSQEFSHPRLVYEVVNLRPLPWPNSLFELFKHYLVKTKTLNLYKKLSYENNHNFLSLCVSKVLTFILANRVMRKFSRFLDEHSVKDINFKSFFDRYQPAEIFLANIFDEAEIAILKEAKRRQVRAVAFINSWDKVTAKGFFRLLPDCLLVPNEIVRSEAIKHDDMPEDKIRIVGVPQYDIYFGDSLLKSRDGFFAAKDFDPKKPLIVFAPMGRAFSNSDWLAIDLLHEIIKKDLGGQAELLVRFQPNDTFEDSEIKFRPWLKYDLPGIRFQTKRGVDWDMTKAELVHLKNTLYHADLVISYASSISIDTACFDKPIINVNFELKFEADALRRPTVRYNTEHYQKALRTGGIRLVSSQEELVIWIKRYLSNPKLDSHERSILVKEQCAFFDGRSGERIAGAIFDNLK